MVRKRKEVVTICYHKLSPYDTCDFFKREKLDIFHFSYYDKRDLSKKKALMETVPFAEAFQ